ncbi:O-antigen ligase family protein [Rhodocytophaga rosea]|uniref:O-antigen ligase family protein n=1 Tax=Rhodocytophaga rosea TaxID=2704465 RepID=A0A6C0GDJ6_9BACT|nr:O-antigen ligase family protein [Rhodocytophaga rosea]QHT66079.1 O-antigen ligase family protein [Rhodocytophaga rosea]
MHVSLLPDTQAASAAIPDTRPSSKRDYHVVLFFWNVAMVIIGYGLANVTGMASLAPMKILRIVLLAFSLIYLFNSRKQYVYIFKGRSSWIIWAFIALNMYVLPFSASMAISLEKFINLVPYFIYLNYFIIYLHRRYNKEQILNMILNVFNIVYVIPLFSFIFLGGNFSQEDIYGEMVGGFISNHYGWSSAIFITTTVDLLRNDYSLSKKRRIIIFFLLLLSCYVLVISGSRSGYLTVALCFLLFILRNTNSSLFVKLASVLLVSFFVIQLYGNENSAFNKRLDKTETQLEKGDARTQTYALGYETMADNPSTIITGFGFYAFREALISFNKEITIDKLKISLHNSYYELLFGSGIFIFTFFVVLFVLNTLLSFFRFHSAHYIFLPPLIFIPFFENNFNPGQFLFFPWFSIMFYYMHYREKQIMISVHSAPEATTTDLIYNQKNVAATHE